MPHSPLRSIALLLTALLTAPVVAQPADADDGVLGHWIGAFARGGAVQHLRAEFFRGQESADLQVRLQVPEWFYYGWLAPKPVTVESDGRISFDGFHGRTTLAHDPVHGELIGPSGALTPPITMHLKRALPPPPDGRREIDLTYPSRDETLVHGTLVLPAGAGPHPLVIHISGRGCSSKSGMRSRGRVMARYGIAAFSFDDRGAGDTAGDCGTTVLADLLADTHAAIDTLARRADIDAARIGLFGVSAGAWTAARAAATSPVPIAAVMTLVGPATSVEEQQRDNCRLICDDLGLSDADRARATRYLDLMFTDVDEPEAQFAEMMALKAHAERTGWSEFFDATDVPDSPAGIERLWVRRFACDPSADWARLTCPVLSVLGGRDRVVPSAKNADRLRSIYGGAPDDLEIIIMDGTGHGSETPDMWRSLKVPGGSPVTYYKFDKVDWRAMVPFVEFALEHLARPRP